MTAKKILKLPSAIIRAGIKLYQCAAPSLMGSSPCRFQPSCSRYADEAVKKYGALKGAYLAFRRLIRCHPFCRGGYDPVP